MSDTTAIDAILDDAAGEPTVQELRQEKNTNPFVMPVEQRGPVQVQTLPAQDATVVNRILDTTVSQIIGSDPRRTRLLLISTSGAFRFGFDPSAVLGIWPANVPLTITSCREVYVTADAANATLTALAEFWTN